MITGFSREPPIENAWTPLGYRITHPRDDCPPYDTSPQRATSTPNSSISTSSPPSMVIEPPSFTWSPPAPIDEFSRRRPPVLLNSSRSSCSIRYSKSPECIAEFSGIFFLFLTSESRYNLVCLFLVAQQIRSEPAAAPQLPPDHAPVPAHAGRSARAVQLVLDPIA